MTKVIFHTSSTSLFIEFALIVLRTLTSIDEIDKKKKKQRDRGYDQHWSTWMIEPWYRRCWWKKSFLLLKDESVQSSSLHRRRATDLWIWLEFETSISFVSRCSGEKRRPWILETQQSQSDRCSRPVSYSQRAIGSSLLRISYQYWVSTGDFFPSSWRTASCVSQIWRGATLLTRRWQISRLAWLWSMLF